MDDLQRIAEALAHRLGRAVAVDGPQLRLLAHTPHTEEVDALRIESVMRMQVPGDVVDHVLAQGIAQAVGPVRVPAAPELRLIARVCVPVRCEGLLLGYLWLLDNGPELSDDDLAAAVDAADRAGEVLLRRQLHDDLRGVRQHDLLEDLLSDDRARQEAAAAALVAEHFVAEGAVVVVLAVSTEDGRIGFEAGMHAVARRAGGLSLVTGDGQGVLLLWGRKEPTATQLRATVRDLREFRAQYGEVRVGIGPAVDALVDVGRSVRRASDALRATQAGLGPVAAWNDLGAYRLLTRLSPEELEDAVPAGLLRLLQNEGDGPLVDTLATWLDEGGDARATIERLSVHRTSLYYRIGRIEEVTGMSLSNGEDRLSLHLGLKAARLLCWA